jgi:ferredoxin
MGAYRILIDRSICAGYGACVDLAPDVFELDASGEASLRVGDTDDRGVLEAADACPMGAISVFETASGKQAA